MDDAAVASARFLRGAVVLFNTDNGCLLIREFAQDCACNDSSSTDDAYVDDVHRDRASMHTRGTSLQMDSAPRSRNRRASAGSLTVQTRTGNPAGRASRMS